MLNKRGETTGHIQLVQKVVSMVSKVREVDGIEGCRELKE